MEAPRMLAHHLMTSAMGRNAAVLAGVGAAGVIVAHRFAFKNRMSGGRWFELDAVDP